MLRPERMSRVSITGTKRVMPDVIETVHDLNLLHMNDYDGEWEGFTPGDPIEGADDASEKLVTVRSIESILDVDEEEAGPPRVVTDEALEEELEEIRTEVNQLDDRRSEVRDELRRVDERLDALDPFVDLGIALDLLSGYDNLVVRAGEGDADSVREAVAGVDGSTEVMAGDETVAVFAAADIEEAVDEALVGAEFTAVEIPDAEGSPSDYADELEHEKQRLESRITTIEGELGSLKLDVARFLLAAEERLSIEVQKAEAPLKFASTASAFVAEGWIPSDRYSVLESAIQEAVGAHAEVEELERAEYENPHHGHETAADGGTDMAMGGDEPPVVQDNPSAFKPFELLVETISRPQYWDLDPTVILFLTFPVFFGFMIGDLGYGVLYLAIGYWLWTSFDSDAIRSLGGIAMWAGGFTILFGILYGEIFGLHLISQYFWEGALGLHGPPMEKGLSPAGAEFARTWLVVVILAGLAHVTLGYIFGFVQLTQGHGLKEAIMEKGSWILLMLGVWIWIFSRSAEAMKPAFLFEAFNGHPYAFGFGGLSPTVGFAGLGLAAVGFVLLLAVEGGVAIPESLNVLVNILSYFRIAAVLLAKAGMAFTVNLLFFGVYAEGSPAEYHFMIAHGPQYVLEHHEHAEILFGGLIHSGIAGVLVGLVILVLGHLVVLALGVTSAGLQSIRLEYVEFFSKFYYEGGAGRAYEPFGYERRHTTE